MKGSIMFALFFFLLGCEAEHKSVGESVGRGVFDRAEYQRGCIVSTDDVIIFWEDGSTTLLRKFVSVPMCKGKYYEIFYFKQDRKFEFIEKGGEQNEDRRS